MTRRDDVGRMKGEGGGANEDGRDRGGRFGYVLHIQNWDAIIFDGRYFAPAAVASTLPSG